MRPIRLVMAVNPATVMALSMGGRASSSQAGAGPQLTQSPENVQEHGTYNGTGCAMSPEEEFELQKRASQTDTCASHRREVDAALDQCAQLAQGAANAANSANKDEIFQEYFKSNNPNQVAERLRRIAEGCSRNAAQGIRIECDPNQPCSLPDRPGELAAVATIREGTTGSIKLCRQAFAMGANSRRVRRQFQDGQCGERLGSLAQLLVHEMSHTTVAAQDTVYDKSPSVNLDAGSSLGNADSYALYARDVANGCQATRSGIGNQRPGNGMGPGGQTQNGGPGNNGGPPNGSPGLDDGSSNGFPGGNNQPPSGFPGPSGDPSGFPGGINGPPNQFPGSDDGSSGFPGGINGPPNQFPGPNGGPSGFPGGINGPPNQFPGSDDGSSGFPGGINGPPNQFPGPNGGPSGFPGGIN